MFLTTRPVLACALAATLASTFSILGCGGGGSTAPAATGGSDLGGATGQDSAATTDTATISGSGDAGLTGGGTDAARAIDAGGALDAGTATADAGSGGPDSGSTWVNPNVAVTAQTAPAGKGLPSFVKVVDSSGAAVGPAALKGKWTVIWFYPAASSFG